MFDYREFMNLMSSRGVNPECSACGEDDWGHGDLLLGINAVDDNRQVQLNKGIALAAFYCRHCGFVRLFAPTAIDAEAEA